MRETGAGLCGRGRPCARKAGQVGAGMGVLGR